MKKLLLSFLLLQSFSVFAYTKSEGLCLESRQTSAFIKIELFEASNPSEKTYIVKYEYQVDGTINQEEMRGNEPQFGVTKATTDRNETLFIVTQMLETEDGLRLRQYVCQ